MDFEAYDKMCEMFKENGDKHTTCTGKTEYKRDLSIDACQKWR